MLIKKEKKGNVMVYQVDGRPGNATFFQSSQCLFTYNI